MKHEQLKVGKRVEDGIFATPVNPYGKGTVKKILKTRVHVDFDRHGVEVYDLDHLQFLKPASKRK